MSFLKIVDPVKRYLIVKECLEITKKIATKTQKATAREITEGTENLPQATQPLGEASGKKEPLVFPALLLTIKITIIIAIKIVLKNYVPNKKKDVIFKY